MNFLELAKKRKTTYNFGQKPISNKDLKKILEASQWAPSCGNSQPWHFIIVKDKKRIEAVLKGTHAVSYPFIQSNPTSIIVFILQPSCFADSQICVPLGEKEQINESRMCLGMSVLNASLEAESLGISSCILTPKQEEVSKILNLNKSDSPLIILGLGYPPKEKDNRKRTRKPLDNLISYEVFKNKKESVNPKFIETKTIKNVSDNSEITNKNSNSKSSHVIIKIAVAKYLSSRISLFKEYIPSNKRAIYITLNTSSLLLKKELEKNKVSLNNLFFIDTILRKDKDSSTTYIKNASSLTELSIALSSLINEKNIDYVFIDSLSLLGIYNSPEIVERFIRYITEKLSEKGVSIIILAIDDKKSEEIISFTSQFCEKTITKK